MSNEITFADVLSYVANTENTDEIRSLFDAGNARIHHLREIEGARKAATLRVDARVRTDGVKPRYLSGLTGRVVSVNHGRKTTATILLDDASQAGSRYAANGRMTVPVACLIEI